MPVAYQYEYSPADKISIPLCSVLNIAAAMVALCMPSSAAYCAFTCANLTCFLDAVFMGVTNRRNAGHTYADFSFFTEVKLGGSGDEDPTVCYYPTIPPECFCPDTMVAMKVERLRDIVHQKYGL